MEEYIQINGFNFFKSTNLYSTKGELFGWRDYTYKLMYERFESFYDGELIVDQEADWEKFKDILSEFLDTGRSYNKRMENNILFLDLAGTYRGFRHLKGLPVRGQRTWSNAWSPYKSNLILRKLKLDIARRVYGNMPVNSLNTIFMAEQVNLMWRAQWRREWREARNKRFKLMENEHTMFKIDLNLMSKGYVDGFNRKKQLSKKKKALLNRNVFTLGFEPGFALLYLRPDSALSAAERSRVKLVISEDNTRLKVLQKKKVAEKKKSTPVKKKKSLWE